MADFTALKAAINAAIKTNGEQEITGAILQTVLDAIVETLGEGAINDLITALSNESTARGNADATLGGSIDGLAASITAINNHLTEGYVYAGIATTSTNPGTPSGKVFYLALTAGTYTNFGNIAVTQGINILKYNGSDWSLEPFVGIDDTPTPNSNNLVKSSGVQNELALGAVYDVSAKNPTAGPNNDGKWESLSALFSDANLNTLIPLADRRGGMSIKYVQSSDNYYVKFFCTADEFTTDVTQWQGVDDKPTAGSDNLVKSGGIRKSITLVSDFFANNFGYVTKNTGTIATNNDYLHTDYLLLNAEKYEVCGFQGPSAVSFCCCYNESKQYLGDYEPSETTGVLQLSILTSDILSEYPTAKYIRLSGKNVSVDSADYPYITYSADHQIFEKLSGLEENVEKNLVMYADTSGVSKNLTTAISDIPASYDRRVIKFINFKDSDNDEQLSLYYFSGSSSNFNKAGQWFRMASYRDFGKDYINTYGLDASSTKTVVTAAASIPNKLRGPLKLMVYQANGKSNLAVFNSADTSVFTNYSYWLRFIDDIEFIINATSPIDVCKKAMLADETLLLQSGTDNIFNFRTAPYTFLGAYPHTGAIAVSDKAPYRITFLVSSSIDNSKTYVYKSFDTADYTNELSEMSLLSCEGALTAGKTVQWSSNNYANKRGTLSGIANTHTHLYMQFAFKNDLYNLKRAFDIANNILNLIVISAKTSTSYPTSYIDFYKPKYSEPIYPSTDIGKTLVVNNSGKATPTLVNISTLNGVSIYQGSTNANKVLVTDESGQVVLGTSTPQGTYTDVVRSYRSAKLYLGDNLLSNSTPVTIGTGWSGNMADGFLHTSGNTAELTINYNTTSGKKYFVELTLGAAAESSIYLTIGNNYFIDVYNGGTSVKIGFIGDGGVIRIKPSTSYSSTVSNIMLKEIVNENEAVSTYTFYARNVNHDQMINNITGFWNVGMGADNTLSSIVNGSRNIGIGYTALANLVSGTRNVGIGTFALSRLIAGERNIAIGADSLWFQEYGDDNIAIGYAALGQMQLDLVSKHNVAIGSNSLKGARVTAEDNVAVGFNAANGVVNNPTKNVAVGYQSGKFGVEGNVAVGYRAGYNTSGSNNISIGRDSGASSSTEQNNSIAIGYNVKTTKSNQVVIGNTDQTEMILLGNKKIIFNQDGTVTWETVS